MDNKYLKEKLEPTLRDFYDGQLNAIKTVGIPVFLMCQKDLDSDLVKKILDSLFDNIADLLQAHTTAGEIRFQNAFPDVLPGELRLHPGARQFKKGERTKLLLASGSIGGKYHTRAKEIREMLRREGIPARVLHTDGSVENVRVLQDKPKRTMAIVQYDIALSILLGDRTAVYKKDVSPLLDTNKKPLNMNELCRMRVH